MNSADIQDAANHLYNEAAPLRRASNKQPNAIGDEGVKMKTVDTIEHKWEPPTLRQLELPHDAQTICRLRARILREAGAPVSAHPPNYYRMAAHDKRNRTETFASFLLSVCRSLWRTRMVEHKTAFDST